MKEQDPFYIGYMPQAPAAIGGWLKKYILLLLILPLLVGSLLVLNQKPYAATVFEFGQPRQFTGVILEHPYPMLSVNRPGLTEGQDQSHYYLVAFGKHGASEATAGLHGKQVSLTGTLIYRDNQTMIELAPGPIEVVGTGEISEAKDTATQVELIGEIVDSKCFLGVMNPGEAKTHKACAIRCVAGGIPPLLVSRQSSGEVRYFLLTGPGGKPVNQQVLN